MAATDITLATVLAAQADLATKKLKHDQYVKELAAAQKRAARLQLEVDAATKVFEEVQKAFSGPAKK